MNRKKKPLPLFEQVPILDAGSEGKAVARVGELVIFVPYVAPGDVVDIQVVRKKKAYLEGRAVRYHQYSDKRVTPFCTHFGLCGGCKWQHLDDDHQLHYKHKQVKDAFDRIGKLQYPLIQAIIPSENKRYYRNKLEYTFSARRWLEGEHKEETPDMRGLGFHLPQLFDRVLDIRECYLQPAPSDAIRLFAREVCLETGLPFYDARTNQGFFRNLWIRNSNQGDWLVILVTGERNEPVIRRVLDRIGEKFPMVNSLMYVVNEKVNDSIADQEVVLYKGKGWLEEKMDDLLFRIGPQSFFQVNTAQALSMYQLCAERLELLGNELVYDLYTGTGTIASFIARKVRQVIGIEYATDAVKDAAGNCRMNGIENVLFFAGDIADLMTDDFLRTHGYPDVVITDPPRAGMHEKVVQQLLKAAPAKIAYISCNPATQARDLAMLAGQYEITLVQPFDMFPHTHHVECLVILERRNPSITLPPAEEAACQ
ncbi:MAG TPA: 23S rRNA (uracil(1939)-C(5))-methyltransferase RlmD [Bacteroidales bacterium]|nr:23S rRNA (uracil(1939)-C(5))-methyltransferase RlmD [Bacteroidales bacterium]HSA43316.1 23S rRNA (uracil(1939)-C(5))-methyltransferase RlmD [Bacteroidales bacterium]